MREERRKYPRTKPEAGFVIAAYNAGSEGRDADAFNHATRLLDISSKGLCMITVGRLREGVALLVELAAPGTRARFRARATVRWSATVEGGGRLPKVANVAGVEFDKVIEAFGEKVEYLTGWSVGRGRLTGPEPRRRHKRFAPPAQVEISCFPRGFWRALGFRENAARRIKDLSLGGAQIVCARRLRAGSSVDLRLEFGRPRIVVVAEGEIRWCRRDTLSLEPRWEAGVVFKRLTARDDEVLRSIAQDYTR
jgi:hypothetical protein